MKLTRDQREQVLKIIDEAMEKAESTVDINAAPVGTTRGVHIIVAGPRFVEQVVLEVIVKEVPDAEAGRDRRDQRRPS